MSQEYSDDLYYAAISASNFDLVNAREIADTHGIDPAIVLQEIIRLRQQL